MKRILLLSAMLVICLTAGAQYYLNSMILAGENPGGLNTDLEYNVGGGLPPNWTTILGPSLYSPAWSPVQTLPFTFHLNGSPVNSYIVSSSGVLTFSTSTALPAPSHTNELLPNPQIPENSLCIWGLAGTGSNDYIVTKTFGTAPHRQHWVFFNSYTGEVGFSGYQFWSIVMEEGTDIVYFVDQRIYGNPVSLTVGIQVDNSTVYQVAASPSVPSYSSFNPDQSDNSYYAFIPGIQFPYDASLVSLDMPGALAITNAPFTLEGELFNYGSAVITSLQLHYSINGGSPVSQAVSGISIPTFGTWAFSHSVPWIPAQTGTYTIQFWATDLNGYPDQHPSNDTLTAVIQLAGTSVPRIPLHEDFTSSMCAPCKPANVNLANIFANNPGEYSCVKYPMAWPGIGDPYYTSECNNRKVLYGVTFVPYLSVDGAYGINGSAYTQALFDSHAAVPAFVDLSATYQISGQSVSVQSLIDPLINFTDPGIRLFVAVIEYETNNNVGSSGETSFHYIMKKMLPDAMGNVVGNLNSGSPLFMNFDYTFQGNYRLPFSAADPINHAIEHSVEQFSDLGVVLWLQNITTWEVLQSCFAVLTQGTLADVGPEVLLSPENGPFAGNNVPVSVKVTNFGASAVSDIPVSCLINGTLLSADTITDIIAPGDFVNFTFSSSADLSAGGAFTLTIFTALPADTNTGNDTLIETVNVYTVFDSLYESFEAVFPPQYWVKYNPPGGDGWNQQAVGTAPVPGFNGGVVTPAPSGNGGSKMAFCTWNTSGASTCDQWLITPQVNISATYELSCWIRKFGIYNDTLDVLISTSGAAPGDFNILLERIGWGVPDSGWVYRSWDLSAYAGQTISIAFREHVLDNQTDGAAIFLDQVRVGSSVIPAAISLACGEQCAGNIKVPLTGSNLQDVASISLSFFYDTSHLQYQSYQQVHPALSSGNTVIQDTGNMISIAWYSMTPVSLTADTLVVIVFDGGTGTSQLSWDLLTPGACYLTDPGAQMLPVNFIDGTVQVISCNNLAGFVRYFNANATPVTNTTLQLIHNGDVAGNTLTSQAGYYFFAGLSPGTGFNLDVQCTKPWGGGNAVDALKAMQHFVNMFPLTELKFAAADVDGSGFVNAVDALTIMKRFVGVQSSFVTGDWIFDDPDITVSTDDTTFQDIAGLCYGDIDASYAPPLKEAPQVELFIDGKVDYQPGVAVRIPLLSGLHACPASLSLVMQVPREVEILDVEAAREGTFLYHRHADELRIAWFSLAPEVLEPGDELFIFTVRQFHNCNAFSMLPGSIAGDLQGNTITPFLIQMPELSPVSPGLWMGEPYPVPFSDRLLLPLSLGEAAEVRIRLVNPIGMAVVRDIMTQLPAGNHEVSLQTAGMLPAVYLMEIEVRADKVVERMVRKVVCVR